MKRVLALFVVSFIPVLSCGGTSALPGDSVEAPTASVTSKLPPAPIADVAAEEESAPAKEATLPAGTFRDLHALCAQQMKEAVPLLEKARAEMVERYADDDIKQVAPSCIEDPAALRGVRVSLAGRYLEAKAVTYETGRSTQTNIVMRTSEGWMNVGTAIVTSDHDDPGCPSILRDAGLTAVRIENGQIVILDKADRGAGENSNIVYERTRTCSLTACTEPETLSEGIVPWN
jgi:hypothetical protein